MLRRALPWIERRPTLRVESLALLASLWFSLACNAPFWDALRAHHQPPAASAPLLWMLLLIVVTAAHFCLFALLLNRWTAKPVLALLIIGTAFAAYYMGRYRVYLDPGMVRNILHTDAREAGELLSWSMALPLAAYAAAPLLLLGTARIRRDPLPAAFAFRAATIALALVTLGAATLLAFRDVSSDLRNEKKLRFLITPGNYLYSLFQVAATDLPVASQPRTPVASDAALATTWQQRRKPALLVLVVGETARAANWGLSGYARQTTPELAGLNVINFPKVTACGTSTEVSLPCMFSPLGRHAYDEARIRSSESLLHVLKRAGFRVLWLDNQSGCKGACAGLEVWRPDAAVAPAACGDGQCRDEALLAGMERALAVGKDNLVLVAHQLGNHGPAYFKRHPAAYRQFTPECENADLSRCTRDEIVNAYDNALLYTDHLLAQTIGFLERHAATHDAAMIYVSDHGESLGENGLFLHGIPYAIAPETQTRVPMVMWLSRGYAASFSLAIDCMRRQARQAVTHDHLFHTVLGMLDVETAVRDKRFDISAACKPQTATSAVSDERGTGGDRAT